MHKTKHLNKISTLQLQSDQTAQSSALPSNPAQSLSEMSRSLDTIIAQITADIRQVNMGINGLALSLTIFRSGGE